MSHSSTSSSAPVPAPPPSRVSLTFSSRPASRPQIPAKRSRAALGDDDDDEPDTHATRAPQAVSGFEDGGAVVNGSEKKRVKTEPLVIPVQRDVEWGRRPGAGKSRGKNLLPAEVQAQQAEREGRGKGANGTENGNGVRALEQAQYGLVLKHKAAGNDVQMTDEADVSVPSTETPAQPSKTVDEEALDRLINGDERTSTLVIAGDSNHEIDSRPTDFRTDILSRPDAPSVADYEAIPIEDFGAAMLRGMGYDGSGVGRNRKVAQPKKSERRPNLLGIGAKQVPEGLEELGAWGGGGKGAKGGKMGPKTRDAYNPLVMRNAATGEVRTEEEVVAGRAREERERMEDEARGSGKDRSRRDESRETGSRNDRSRRDDTRERGSRDERPRLKDRERRPREDRDRYDDGRDRRERDERPHRSHESGGRRHRSRSRQRSPRPSHRDDRDRRREDEYRRDRDHRHRSSRH